MKLTPGLIYEAALDDQLFAELPVIIAQSLDARSCVVHWRDDQGAAEISAHSGYFSDEQMANYAINFAEHDLWTEAGMRTGYINRAWRTSDLVAEHDYSSSIFYNDWIRGMGDDTFYCCGSVMRTAQGDGCVGLHRGRGQKDFSEAAMADLDSNIDHLRRMFAIRSRIADQAGQRDSLQALFSVGLYAAITARADGRITMANQAADALLRGGRLVRSRHGRIEPAAERDRAEFSAALARAGDPANPAASTCLIQASDGSVAMISFTPVMTPMVQSAVLITIDDRQSRVGPDVIIRHLRSRYHLSNAEAEIAMMLAQGASPRDIAEQRRSALTTVRTQVKTILFKMDARRQGDVIRMIGAIGPVATAGALAGALAGAGN